MASPSSVNGTSWYVHCTCSFIHRSRSPSTPLSDWKTTRFQPFKSSASFACLIVVCSTTIFLCFFASGSSAKGLYGVPFPHYDMPAEIYGKDRATGAASESFAKAAHDIDVEIMNESVTIPSDDDFEAEAETETESMQSTSRSTGHIS